MRVDCQILACCHDSSRLIAERLHVRFWDLIVAAIPQTRVHDMDVPDIMLNRGGAAFWSFDCNQWLFCSSHAGRKKLYLDEIPCQDSGVKGLFLRSMQLQELAYKFFTKTVPWVKLSPLHFWWIFWNSSLTT